MSAGSPDKLKFSNPTEMISATLVLFLGQLLHPLMSRKRRADNLASEDEESDDSLSVSEDSISADSNEDSDDESSGGEEELVNCDFEFFDPQKQDYLGIKHLLRQLFDTDADLFDLGELAEIILAQPLLGTTVKTEGHEGDPLSFLTVLNLRTHRVRSTNVLS
jgi:hypothetical protein